MNIKALQVLARLRGEYELEELYQDSEASLRPFTGDNWSDKYLTGRLFKMDDRGSVRPVEAA